MYNLNTHLNLKSEFLSFRFRVFQSVSFWGMVKDILNGYKFIIYMIQAEYNGAGFKKKGILRKIRSNFNTEGLHGQRSQKHNTNEIQVRHSGLVFSSACNPSLSTSEWIKWSQQKETKSSLNCLTRSFWLGFS